MRVALLMNFIAPYRVRLLEALRDRVDELRVFISTPMESDRAWEVDWGSLDVVVQRNVTVRRPYRDEFGFSRQLQIHFPYDTLPQRALHPQLRHAGPADLPREPTGRRDAVLQHAPATAGHQHVAAAARRFSDRAQGIDRVHRHTRRVGPPQHRAQP